MAFGPPVIVTIRLRVPGAKMPFLLIWMFAPERCWISTRLRPAGLGSTTKSSQIRSLSINRAQFALLNCLGGGWVFFGVVQIVFVLFGLFCVFFSVDHHPIIIAINAAIIRLCETVLSGLIWHTANECFEMFTCFVWACILWAYLFVLSLFPSLRVAI